MEDDLFDFDGLVENYMGEKEIVIEVIGVFIEKVKSQIDIIENSIKIKDYEKIKFESHSIKGGAYNLTINQLGKSAENIEAASKIMDLDCIKANFEKLKSDFQVFLDIVKEQKIFSE